MADDLARLVADLSKAGAAAERDALPILKREAQQMKEDWQRRVTGVFMLRGLPSAVSYDILPTGLRALTAEVGYEKRGQGNLGNIVEFGSARHGPIRPAGEPVLKAGADRLERFLGDVGEKML